MKLHGNARTCPNGRKLLVCRILGERWSLAEAAAAAVVSERSARKWVGRFEADGEAGLQDRSSAPRRIPHRTSAGRVESIKALRKLWMTAAEIAAALDMALDGFALA
jgi:transposase